MKDTEGISAGTHSLRLDSFGRDVVAMRVGWRKQLDKVGYDRVAMWMAPPVDRSADPLKRQWTEEWFSEQQAELRDRAENHNRKTRKIALASAVASLVSAVIALVALAVSVHVFR